MGLFQICLSIGRAMVATHPPQDVFFFVLHCKLVAHENPPSEHKHQYFSGSDTHTHVSHISPPIFHSRPNIPTVPTATVVGTQSLCQFVWAPAAIDGQYPRGTFYPGVFRFLLELSAHGHDRHGRPPAAPQITQLILRPVVVFSFPVQCRRHR